jgi:hypothetical protein
MPLCAAVIAPKETTMSVIDDLTTAVETYPKSNVQIQIEDVEFPGDVLNVDEEGSFKVRVTNNGPLNLTDVTVKLKGLNGAQVRAGPPILGYTDESEANITTSPAMAVPCSAPRSSSRRRASRARARRTCSR